ncbi:MAG: hypothetical protein ACRDJG_10915 [Actinomycetota bacterium]
MARVAGRDFDLDVERVQRVARRLEAEPIQRHYVVIGGRRFPPKQVLAAVTGLDRADFTTHQARAILRRLGFGVHRRGEGGTAVRTSRPGPHGGAEAELLEGYLGRWVAQNGLEVLFDASSPEAVLRWLRRHGRQARIWRVPASVEETGSFHVQ